MQPTSAVHSDSATRFRDQEEQSTRQRAAILGLQYVDVRENGMSDKPLTEGVLTTDEMYAGKIVPLQPSTQDQPLVMGITSATPQSLLRTLRERFMSQSIQFVLISNEAFRDFMHRFDPPKTVIYDDVVIAKEGDSNTVSQVSQTLDTVRSDDILKYLIEQADKLGASDIHIECQADNVRIRMRVDGTLHVVAALAQAKYRALQGAIASQANISTVSTAAQTGHIRHAYQRGDERRVVNMRIETVPTVYGQDAVIRLFNFDESLLQIDKLGLRNDQLARIREVISHPHGMVMVVGPTGSGKSTTLYSILNALNDPSRKMITLEDPVEFSIPGVSQIPVNTTEGDNFADKLKAVLRLDPDVLMVGEVRDVDTARTAVQSAVTGHLVLTTFHADSAAAALSRMVDLIGRNPIFSTAIKLVISQRLVRRLDDATKQAYEADTETAQWIRDVLRDLPDGTEGLPPAEGPITLYKAVPSADSPFGFRGRVSIMEQLPVTQDIQQFLKGATDNANTESIEDAARRGGMITMTQDGVLKVLAGVTTLDELNRVI